MEKTLKDKVIEKIIDLLIDTTEFETSDDKSLAEDLVQNKTELLQGLLQHINISMQAGYRWIDRK